MAKIAICEDSTFDIVNKYGFLCRSAHDVHIYWYDARILDPMKGALYSQGFKDDNMHDGVFSAEMFSEISSADLIFMDGLKGNCFEIIDGIPKSERYKIFVVTGSEEIRIEALIRSIQVERKLPQYLEKIVRTL